MPQPRGEDGRDEELPNVRLAKGRPELLEDPKRAEGKMLRGWEPVNLSKVKERGKKKLFKTLY